MDQPISNPPVARFELGRIVVTHTAQSALDSVNVSGVLLLARHVHGDWGEMNERDELQNELALLLRLRLLSSYTLPDGGRVWIITEADRSLTTVQLPDN